MAKIHPQHIRLGGPCQPWIVYGAMPIAANIEIIFKNNTFRGAKVQLQVLTLSNGQPLCVRLQRLPQVTFVWQQLDHLAKLGLSTDLHLSRLDITQLL
jgi:hypothetical protein